MTSFLRDLCALHLYGPFSFSLYQKGQCDNERDPRLRQIALVNKRIDVARMEFDEERRCKPDPVKQRAIEFDHQDRKPREGRDL